jgi:hypothetical protein
MLLEVFLDAFKDLVEIHLAEDRVSRISRDPVVG